MLIATGSSEPQSLPMSKAEASSLLCTCCSDTPQNGSGAPIPVRHELLRKKEHATKRSIAFLLAEGASFDTGIFSVLDGPMYTLRCWPALRVSPLKPDKSGSERCRES